MEKHRKTKVPNEQTQKKKKLGRDTLFLVLGVLTFLHELVIYKGEERYGFILAALMLMGVPAANALDSLRKKE